MSAKSAISQVRDPEDLFSFDYQQQADSDEDDKLKDADQLIAEASVLLQDDRPLDARTKLLRALAKDPKAYRAHMLLSNYYMVHVGHFRLALKYAKQALNLFYETEGKPPYFSYLYRTQHSYLLYLLSQSRLNLDDYQGALDVLDEYNSYGYQDDWYHSTRAWILMKMGQIDQAISVAREGAAANAEVGRTLNILGILLSMKGEREASIDIFEKAIRYEFSQGSNGYPATPLNNVGEVYKEIFQESKAQASWIKAVGLPDGCEHVLPALNLAMLMIDEMNLSGAKRTMDNFEACILQFPLKNGEEHSALVHLARGRIDLHAGLIADAQAHFEEGISKQQWFGKIGTSKDDLEVALTISLAQSLQIENKQLKLKLHSDIFDSAKDRFKMASNEIKYWWLLRRARQKLINDLNLMEDLFIRNTDSMIEYPSFGTILRLLPEEILKKKIELELKEDSRPEAKLYYDLYLAENKIEHGNNEQAIILLNQVLSNSRVDGDALLRARALTEKLTLLNPESPEYITLSEAAYKISPALLRNAGLALPVNVQTNKQALLNKFEGSNFMPLASKDLPFQLIIEDKESLKLTFIFDKGNLNKSFTVTAGNFAEGLNKLAGEVFSQKIQ